MSEKGTRGQRIYLIREALGTRRDPLPLEKFAALIAETTGVRYDKSVLSRKETGQIPVSIDDIEAIAAVDPLKRGKAWLAGWDDEGDNPVRRVAEPTPPRPRIPVERPNLEDYAVTVPVTPRRKSAKRSRKGDRDRSASAG